MSKQDEKAERTQFDYLLNAFEAASQAAEPAKHAYREKRVALFAYVRDLEACARRMRASSAAEREGEALDAVRYRWLRETDLEGVEISLPGEPQDGSEWVPEELDAAIDALAKEHSNAT